MAQRDESAACLDWPAEFRTGGSLTSPNPTLGEVPMRLTLIAATLATLLGTGLAQAQTAASAPMAAAKAAVVEAASSAKSAVAESAAALKAAAAAGTSAAASTDAQSGKIAYYGRKFAGRKTASGQRFNPGALTMAHPSLPFGTLVKVTNTKNNRSVVVRVNDRGPTTAGRIGDVSRAAAARLKMLRSGVVEARLEVVGQAATKGMAHRKAKRAAKA